MLRRRALLAALPLLLAACGTPAFDPESIVDAGPPVSTDGGTAESPDPCLTRNGGCDAHADCAVVDRAVTCSCRPGYSGNGETCESLDGPLDTVVEVPAAEAYGTRTFTVHAKTNWVNTGLYLKAGERAELLGSGSWQVGGRRVDADGAANLERQRGCAVGSLVARSGLRFEDAISCIGVRGTFVAPRDGVVYVGMISSTDLGEAYGERLALDGALEVTIVSDGRTVPSVRAQQLELFPFEQVQSGRVELLGRHVIVDVSTAEVLRDLPTAAQSIETLDRIYEIEAELRGMAPFDAQRIRFYSDDGIGSIGYMVAGNPIRCVPELMGGNDRQRILRSSVANVDIWGFSHELGHTFSFANGAWVYQYVNLESWPNIFTLRALSELNRMASQPNADSYCNGKDDYLASGAYETLRNDPFVQLCFLTQFTDKYGWSFWSRFFRGMNSQSNNDIVYDGTDASIWRYVRDRFTLAAGEDVTPLFRTWRVPLE